MKRGTSKPVTMPERNRMRALRARGLTYRVIGEMVGRTWNCVRNHSLDVVVTKPEPDHGPRIRRLTRMERFIASCNRAVGEARP